MSYDTNLHRTIQLLKEENARLKQVLEYYADQSNWNIKTTDNIDGIVAEFNVDDIYVEDGRWACGKRANQVLR